MFEYSRFLLLPATTSPSRCGIGNERAMTSGFEVELCRGAEFFSTSVRGRLPACLAVYMCVRIPHVQYESNSYPVKAKQIVLGASTQTVVLARLTPSVWTSEKNNADK